MGSRSPIKFFSENSLVLFNDFDNTEMYRSLYISIRFEISGHIS